MPFVAEEVLHAAPRPSATPPLHLPSGVSLWLERLAALLLSALLVGAVIALLIMAGVIPAGSMAKRQHILFVDFVSAAQSEAGAVSRVAPAFSSPSSVPTELDLAKNTETRREWSMTKLPPLPQTRPVPPAAQAAAEGQAANGAAAGDGFDPFSYASYQPELAARATSAAILVPNPEMLLRLQDVLRRRLIDQRISIKLQVMVAKDGRIVRAEVGSPLPSRTRAIVLAEIEGASLFPANAARPDQVQTTILLTI